MTNRIDMSGRTHFGLRRTDIAAVQRFSPHILIWRDAC